jgi:hypothetical protein
MATQGLQQGCALTQQDGVVADLLVSLVAAASTSYRRASVCKPIPTLYQEDPSGLAAVVVRMPSVATILSASSLDTIMTPPCKQLLDWLLNTKPLSLHVANIPEFETHTKISLTKLRINQRPTHIFRIDHDPSHNDSKAFTELAELHGTFYGFHGSPTENWHSILRNGLDAGRCKETCLFGDGVYLSEDPVVACNFVKTGPAWKGSMFGHNISCVGVCEVVNDGAHVKRSHNDPTLPKTYILVKGNKYLRLRYLLLYSDVAKKGSSKGFMFLLFYLVLLGFLFYARSPGGKRLLKWY